MPKIKCYLVDFYGDDYIIGEISASTYAELAAIMPQRTEELKQEMFKDCAIDRLNVCCTCPLVRNSLDVVTADLLAGYNVSLFCI